jgi:hypothetical protein
LSVQFVFISKTIKVLLCFLVFDFYKMPGPKKRSASGEPMDGAKTAKVGDDSMIQQSGEVSELPAGKFDDSLGLSSSKNIESDKASVGVTSIVTPEKPSPSKRLFLMNTKAGTYVETESSVSAKLLKSQLVRLGSDRISLMRLQHLIRNRMCENF